MTQAISPALVDQTDFALATIGKPWASLAQGPDAFDCLGLAAKGSIEVFGRALPWSSDFVTDATNMREVMQTLRACRLLRFWQPVSDPHPGDLVIFSKSSLPCHIGIWLELSDGSVGILHAEQGRGVVFEGLAEARASWARVEFRRSIEGSKERLESQEIASNPDAVIMLAVKDPMDPMESVNVLSPQIGTTVYDAALEAGLDADLHWACLNGVPLLRDNPETREDEWTRVLQEGDVLFILPPLPEGGGDDGSATIATLISVVVSIAAPYLAGYLLPNAAPWVVSAVGAGIAIGANLLIGSLVKPPKPMELADPEPTYAFGSPRNSIRPGGNIPRPYGTMRRTPDLLAQPWGQFENNEQLLHLLLCVGLGDQDITEFGIADTAVWDEVSGFTGAIEDVDYEIIKPGGRLTLFPANVEVNTEVDGIELPVPDPSEVQIGPFTAVQSGRTATRLVFDFVFPTGLFSTSGDSPNRPGNYFAGDFDNGVDSAWATWKIFAREIDDAGNAIGAYFELAEITFAAASTTPQRWTRGYNVAEGRYECYVVRTSGAVVTGQGQETLAWYGLKAHQTLTSDIPNVTALAIRVRASAASTAASQEWFVRSTAVLPHFDEAGNLVTGRTENIEAPILDIVRSDYALNLTDERIDMPQLKALAAKWRARGDVCCTSIEDDVSAWDVLKEVCTAGRTIPQFVGSTITFKRDEEQILPPKAITHSDMVRGSFKVEYAHHRRDNPNVVLMRFRNREGKMETIECAAPGITKKRIATVDTKVHVDRAHAWRDGLFMAASNQMRRKYATFSMLADGRALVRGDTVEISHPRVKWGAPTKLAAVEWPLLAITGSTILEVGQQGWVKFTRPDGSTWGPVKAEVTEDPSVLKVDETDFEAALISFPASLEYNSDPRAWLITEAAPEAQLGETYGLDGTQSEATRIIFGSGPMESKRCKLLELIPDGDQVQVYAVVDEAAVYTADTEALPNSEIGGFDLSGAADLVWSGALVVATEDLTPGYRLRATGNTVNGAVEYVAETASSTAVGDWGDRVSASAPDFSFDTPREVPFVVRVAAKNGVQVGPWKYFSFNSDPFPVPSYDDGPGNNPNVISLGAPVGTI